MGILAAMGYCLVVVLMKGLATASSTDGDASSDYVDVHNEARQSLELPLLEWNSTLASYALDYANYRSKDCKLIHSGGPYGENIAVGYEPFSGADAVRFWLTEQPFYDYATNSCADNKVCGHYTQIVWKDTVRLGCAKVSCLNPEDAVFIICSYDPPGNYVGERPY